MVGDRRTATVSELQRDGVLFVEDGNHGEYRPLANEFVPAGTPFVRPDDLKDGRVDFATCDRINDQALKRVRKGKGRGGDIVFTHRATVGRIARVGLDAPDFVANPGVTVWRSTSPDVLDPVYLYFFMQTPVFMNQVWAEAGNTDTFPYVSLTQQRALEIALPCIEQQRAVAHILGTLDDKIELNRRMNETLETMARALFKSWFVDFDPVRAKAEGRDPRLPQSLADLFPNSFEDSELGETPKGWAVGPLGHFFEVGLGGAWGNDEATTKASVAVRCMRGIDCHELAEGRIPDVPVRWVSHKQAADRHLSDGTVLLEGSGSFCGRSMIWKQAFGELIGEPVGYSNFCKRLDPVCSASQAIICWMQMRQAYRDGLLQSYRTGTAFPNFDVHGALASLIVVVPPEPIANVFGRMFGVTQRLDLMAQSRTVAALRDTLLPKLVSGELRVKDAERFIERGAS